MFVLINCKVTCFKESCICRYQQRVIRMAVHLLLNKQPNHADRSCSYNRLPALLLKKAIESYEHRNFVTEFSTASCVTFQNKLNGFHHLPPYCINISTFWLLLFYCFSIVILDPLVYSQVSQVVSSFYVSWLKFCTSRPALMPSAFCAHPSFLASLICIIFKARH